MNKKLLKILTVLSLPALMVWGCLLYPDQNVEAGTGQQAGLISQLDLNSSMNFQELGKLLLLSAEPTAIKANQISLLKIQTMPATAGMRFNIGEQSFVSDRDGIVTIPMNNGCYYTLAVDPSSANTADSQYQFALWSDGTAVIRRSISINEDTRIQVGFKVYNKIGMVFKDSNGNLVAPSRVSLISMQDALGDSFSFLDGQPRWLLASVIERQANQLKPESIQYSLVSVLVDGENVVDQSKQVFFAHPGISWPLALQLYTIHVIARDAIFQNPVGNGVALEYPNGSLETIPFGAKRDVTISSLEQGNYHLQVTGVSGISSYTPVTLSQNQEVDLMLSTRADLITAFVSGILFALALLFGVRAWFMRNQRHGSARILEQTVQNLQTS